MPNISSNLPLYPISKSSWIHIQSLPLADPNFATPGQVDLLLAGDVYAKIIQSGLCKGQTGEPVAQHTSLGWILSGEVVQQNHVTFIQANNFHVSTIEISECMKRFQEMEEVPIIRRHTKEDEWTEAFYEQTYQRQANGKFMVRLPFKFHFDPSFQLGSSFSMALKRFASLQRRFARDEQFRIAYTQTFDEYKQLNQNRLVDTVNDDLMSPPINHFYLPHHAILKESSLTTKLRQVFDASAKSSNECSLNDVLTTGPALQSDLVSIILNWRMYRYVFVADIEKMYRCIDVHPDDTEFQRLLWQDTDGSIRTYALQTVTFGVGCSPYLAIKTLHKLVELERIKFPLAFSAIKNETYVDDVTSGQTF